MYLLHTLYQLDILCYFVVMQGSYSFIYNYFQPTYCCFDAQFMAEMILYTNTMAFFVSVRQIDQFWAQRGNKGSLSQCSSEGEAR